MDDVTIETRNGYTEFGDADVNGIAKDALQTDELADEWQKTDYYDDYGNWESEISGNWHVSCVVQLEVPKIDRDWGMFGEYEVKLGARVYASETAATFAPVGEFATTYDLVSPDYETDTNLQADEEEYMHSTIEEKEWDVDVEKALGYDGRGEQRLEIELIASPYVTEDDIVLVTMTLDLPEDALTEGTIVYHYVQLLPEGATAGTDDFISVGCQHTAGVFGTTHVDNYQGTSKLDAASTAG